MPAPTRTLDALTSATLKHVRDDWWDEAFTTFLVERLRPRVGNRILDVGCGTGGVELRLARLRIPQVTFVGIDRSIDRALIADLTARLERRMAFALSIHDRELFLSIADVTLSGPVKGVSCG